MRENTINNSTVSTVIDCLDIVGVQIPDLNEDQDVDLTEYDMDSLTFIAFIIEVEKKFDIIIPDEFLLYNNYKSLYGFCEFIESTLKEKKE